MIHSRSSAARHILGMLTSLPLLASLSAKGAEPDSLAGRNADAELARAGALAYEDGDYATAIDRLSTAFQSLRAPSVGLWLGRAYMHTGRLLEAAKTFRETQQLTPEFGNREVQRQAQADAAREEKLLLPRIPGIVLVCSASAPPSTIQLDGEIVQRPIREEKHPVNPGPHDIVVTCAGKERALSVVLAEGETKAVPLSCPAPPPKPSAGSQRAPLMHTSAEVEPASIPASVWLALGVGAAGLAVGSVAGIVGLTKADDLDSRGCRDGRCPSTVPRSEVDSLNSWRRVSSIGFIVGAVGTAAGMTLLLTRAGSGRPQSAVHLGPQSLSLAMSF